MTVSSSGTPIQATLDRSLRVRVVRQVPLMYRAGADPFTDRPAHVRAGSGLAWVGDQLAVVQDDANFLALIDVESGLCDVVLLPVGEGNLRQFDDARGNKAHKYDFEALCAIGNGVSQVIAFGSGSSERRENILLVSDAGVLTADVRVRPAKEFYAGLRACTAFAGSELNIEGAALVGDHIRLFGRGNGAPRNGLFPINATCDINVAMLLSYLESPTREAPPAPTNVVQYLLGDIDDVRLSFTDAVAIGRDVLYVAAAEDSPDAVRDGVVAGSALGVITQREGGIVARWTQITTGDGALARHKVEGLAIGHRLGQMFAVVDRDDHNEPSELCELEISGFALDWPAAQR